MRKSIVRSLVMLMLLIYASVAVAQPVAKEVDTDENQWPASMASGTLPILYINTEDGVPVVDKETKINASLWVEVPEKCDSKDFVLGSAESPVTLTIKGRGNSTWTHFDKKPYKVKFDKKQSLLGMPKHKHFALLACAENYNAWVSQVVGMELARLAGMGWVPRTEPVELVLNGEYLGMYFVFESIKIDSERLDIYEQPEENVDPETIPYGWLVEVDNYDDEFQIKVPEGVWTTRITHKIPEVVSDQQRQWLTDCFTEIFEVLNGDDNEHWVDYFDAESMIKYFMVREVMTDWDGFNGSIYMYRDMGDTKWHLGPHVGLLNRL